jgi:two-component system, sensor histidine kinase and response regulator
MKQQILVIEDSRTQSKYLEELLISNGCDAYVALNGETAREKFNARCFDLILLDMVLPDASGLQLLKEIRDSKYCASTIVLILSGVTDKGNIIDALSQGANDYITKPFHQAELLLRLNLHLNIQKANLTLRQTVAAKDKLISVIAHDLRDPFNGLLGFAKMLVNAHRTLNEDQRDLYVNMVFDSALGMFELLNNLVMWAGIQKSEMKPALQLIQPHVLIDESLTILKPTVDSKKIFVTLDLDKRITLEADPNMFSCVIRNLITNSLRFTQPGQKMTLSSVPKEENNQAGLEFNLHIAGAGFPASLIEATRAIENEKGPQGRKGLGLGLSLTLDFVGAHNGEITFENLPDNGGNVRFFIPNNQKNPI